MTKRDEESTLFSGGGDLGARMAALDWATTTPLGGVDRWPQSLLSVLGICLRSRFPIAIYWGRELSLLYNDAWSPILGSKHPWALGRGAREVWPEIWDAIGPLFQQVMETGESTYNQDALLPMHRHGYTEECYFNFTFTPVRAGGGAVEGVFNAVIETTFRVISERRSRVLRGLTDALAGVRTHLGVAEAVSRALEAAPHDVPFCALYVVDEANGTGAHRAVSIRMDNETTAPEAVALHDDGPTSWPFAAATASGRLLVVDELRTRFGHAFGGGAWPEATDTAFILPLRAATKTLGFLIIGKNPRRAIDDDYRQFVERIGSLVAGALGNIDIYQQERQRAEALAELDRAKTVFFSNISHEFRTPLTLMIGPTEDALSSASRSLQGDDLDIVYRNELRLLKLVNALLDFSRIEAGRAQGHYEPVDLARLTTDLASMFRSTIERGGLRFEVSCPPLSEPVYVDTAMWEKVVLNLLSNAFKYTQRGSIRLSLQAVGDHVEMAVRDTGIGISEEDRLRVFQRFQRVEGARGRTHEGSGIGLALVQDLVKLHGGTIALTSVLGEGSTFAVSIPRGRAHLPAAQVDDGAKALHTSAAELYVSEATRWLAGRTSTEQVRQSPAAAGRILIADDNVDMREYLVRTLQPQFSVDVVTNGIEALARARSNAPDLILSDIMMPELDGLGLLRELRADESTAHIPVILLSARAGDDSRVEGLRAGADDYLVKPFSAAELIARIGVHLAQVASRRALEQHARLLAAANDEAQRARAAAEDANRSKDEFLAMLGHELRNPLAPIVTALHLLRMRGRESDGREHMIIERQVGHLVRLVDDLLDISRITRGKIELRKDRVELMQVVLRGLEMADPLLEQRRQHVELQVSPAGLPIEVDPARLAQVTSNLLTNAAKYSEPGTVVRVVGERDGDWVVLRVIDQGIGLSEDLRTKVFDLFVQQQQALDRSKGGLGLGLAIVRSLVEMHGGRVSVHSDGAGKGSEFIVHLPLAPSAGDEASKPATRTPVPGSGPAPSKRRRIMVVDDNLDAAEAIADVMRDLGHDVMLAHDGPSALKVAAAFHPEVCLLDIGLPVMDGYELAARLRAEQHLAANARMIALTGYGQDADRRRSTEGGFDAHLVKPVDLDVLIEAVGR